MFSVPIWHVPIILWALPYFLVQQGLPDLPCLVPVPVLKSAISQRALVPVRGEQYLEDLGARYTHTITVSQPPITLNMFPYLINPYVCKLSPVAATPDSHPITLHTDTIPTLLLWHPTSSHCCPATIWDLTRLVSTMAFRLKCERTKEERKKGIRLSLLFSASDFDGLLFFFFGLFSQMALSSLKLHQKLSNMAF